MDSTDGSQNGMDYIQSMDVSMDVIQISADRLEGLRTTCSTSASLTQQEIRSLETKLIRMFSELLIKRSRIRERIPTLIGSGIELRQWLRVVGLCQESINCCLQRINSLEQLLEKTNIELKNLLSTNTNTNPKDEEARRLENATNNLKKCWIALVEGKKVPDNLYWDSWDRHHHRNSGVIASPRTYRNKHQIKTMKPDSELIQSTLAYNSVGNFYGLRHTPTPSPPNSPAVISNDLGGNVIISKSLNRKSGTPPPKKKHETFLQPSTPSHSMNENNCGKFVVHNSDDLSSQIDHTPEKLAKIREVLRVDAHGYIHHEDKSKMNSDFVEIDTFSPTHSYQPDEMNNTSCENVHYPNNLQVPRSPCTPNIPIPSDPRQMKHMIQHRFTKVFKMRSIACDLCRKQMFFGLKCKDCKYRCHKDCESNVPPSCGCPKEFIDVFMQTLLNNDANTSPNLGNARVEFFTETTTGYYNNTTRRHYHHYQKSQIQHPDSSSPGSSCNSSSPSSPALFSATALGNNHQQQPQPLNQHSSGIHSAGMNQIPTPSSSSGTNSMKQISQFNFPDVTITNQSKTKVLHSNSAIAATNSSNQMNNDHGSTPSTYISQVTNSMGNFNNNNNKQMNINQIRPPLSELAETHKSNDSDKTVSLSESTSASTDSDRTPGRLDSTEENDSGHWLRQNSLSLKEWDIPYDDLRVLEKIGKGRFGTVHRALWHGDVAVKLLKEDYLLDERTLEAFKLEVANFKKTRHENLVLFMGACMNPPYLAIVTALCKGNTLYTYIHQRRDKFTINRSTLIAQQISQGMGYLHARGILHKDLRTKNIFMENGRVIITDFGLFSSTKLFYCDLGLGVPSGWLCYLAPELMRSLTPFKPTDEILPFSKASDIYSFGTVWYELLCGEFPFKVQPPESVIWQVGRGMKQTLANLQTSRDVKEILMTCWSYQAIDRPDFSKLLTQLEKLPKKRLARSPSHPVSLSRSAESVF